MIHDAIVPVTCDICQERIEYKNDGWTDLGIQIILPVYLKNKGWTIIDGKHYCSEECARDASHKDD